MRRLPEGPHEPCRMAVEDIHLYNPTYKWLKNLGFETEALRLLLMIEVMHDFVYPKPKQSGSVVCIGLIQDFCLQRYFSMCK